jgi:hypothetical protein
MMREADATSGVTTGDRRCPARPMVKSVSAFKLENAAQGRTKGGKLLRLKSMAVRTGSLMLRRYRIWVSIFSGSQVRQAAIPSPATSLCCRRTAGQSH